jgi:N-acetylglucosaminyldiphosphoundecaprenol N-acetyl-beta-D-mannosaminyltransferase
MKPGGREENTFRVLSSHLLETDSEQLMRLLEDRALQSGAIAVDFSDTQLVTLRQHDPAFAELTRCLELLVPASWPLTWAMSRLGSVMKSPIDKSMFMRAFLSQTTPDFRHYFIGESEECNNRLRERLLKQNPDIDAVGFFHGMCSPAGYLQPSEVHDSVIEELREKEPHFIWVGLAAPKRYGLISNLKRQLHSGILLSVGSAFEANAGMRRRVPLLKRLLGADLKDTSWFFLRVLSSASK